VIASQSALHQYLGHASARMYDHAYRSRHSRRPQLTAHISRPAGNSGAAAYEIAGWSSALSNHGVIISTHQRTRTAPIRAGIRPRATRRKRRYATTTLFHISQLRQLA